MNIDADKMEKQEMNVPYEQPSLKKYGTMKEFTLNTSGSLEGGIIPMGKQGGDHNNPNMK